MRFSVSSLIVISTYLLNTAAADVERAESIATSEHASAPYLGSRAVAGLLDKRQVCGNGSGPCPNDATCCPIGGDCCGHGRCCDPGHWCYTSSICCGNNQNGCAHKGCCFKGQNCCADGSCCDSGWYCYKSESHGGAIRCCRDGKVCI